MNIYKVVFVCMLVFGFLGNAVADLNNGLIAYYPFDGNANDSSGNSNHGINNGEVSYTTGKKGQSAFFDGINDYISIVDNDSFDLPNIGSISLWFKLSPKSDDPNNVLINKYRADTSNEDGYTLGVNQLTENEMFGWAKDDKGNVTNNAITVSDLKVASVPFETWVHYSFVFENNMATHYVNGVLQTTVNNKAIDVSQGNSNILLIGAGMSNISQVYNFFSGLIDDVRIYNRALSKSEIEQLYQGINSTVSATPTPTTSENTTTSTLSESLIGKWLFSPSSTYISFNTDGTYSLTEGSTNIDGTYSFSSDNINFSPAPPIAGIAQNTQQSISLDGDTLIFIPQSYTFNKIIETTPTPTPTGTSTEGNVSYEVTVTDNLMITLPKLSYQGLYYSAVLDYKSGATAPCWEARDITPLTGMSASSDDTIVSADLMITISKLNYQGSYYSAVLDYNGSCWTARDIQLVTASTTTSALTTKASFGHNGFDFSENVIPDWNNTDLYTVWWTNYTYPTGYKNGDAVWATSWDSSIIPVKDQGDVSLASVKTIPTDWTATSSLVDYPLLLNHVYISKARDGYVKFKVLSLPPLPIDPNINNVTIEVEYIYTSGNSF